MRRPEPIWECEYKHDRREHRHRCLRCSRIINAGEMVVMHRKSKGTRAAHIECAALPHGPVGTKATTRDIMRIWGLEYLKATGWKVSDKELMEPVHA
jgi:hypothetical protein